MINFICFTVYGCSDPKLPIGASIDRQGNHALITCASSDDMQWKITCKEGQWDGDIGDCSGSKLTYK